MADEPVYPGAFGVDHLQKSVDDLRRHLDALLMQQQRETQSLLTYQHRETHAATHRIEGQLKRMAGEFENLKQLIDDQGGVIAQEATQINAKLDENNRLIEELRNQVGNDPRLVQLADQLRANNQAIGEFIPDAQPEPVPEPGPTPAPEGRRR